MHDWLKQFPEKHFPKDTPLFLQGDPLEYCFYITDGVGTQTNSYANGVEIIIKYRFPGSLLNSWGVMKGRPAYTSSCFAKTDVRAIIIPASIIQTKLADDFEFNKWAVEIMMAHNQYVYELYQKKSKGSTPEMLCYSILALSQTTPNGTRYLPKVLSMIDLAQHLRIHRVTVSHIFKFLQAENIIQKCSLGWKILDVPALEKYACGDAILTY